MQILISSLLPNTVRYYCSFDSGERKQFYNIVMELAEGGDLSGQVKCTPAPSMTLVKDWFVQCLSGLSYMHEQRILHQDIKPDNILLSSSKQIKIADLGLACVAQTSSKKRTLIQWRVSSNQQSPKSRRNILLDLKNSNSLHYLYGKHVLLLDRIPLVGVKFLYP